MRNKTYLSIGTLAVLLAICGCTTGQDNSGRAIKMQRSSGKMNHEQHDAAYYAICKDTSADTHPTAWQGPLRTDKERAMRDVNDHNTKYSNHHAEVAHY